MLNLLTLRDGFYVGIVVIILALSGIFSVFEGREVIVNRLALDTLALILMLGVAGFITAYRVRERDTLTVLLNGVVGSLVTALCLIAVILLETAIPFDELRFVFANYASLIPSVVTFGYAESELIFPGLALLLGFAALMGAVSGGLIQLPGRIRGVILLTLSITIIIALLENQINDVMTLPDALAIALAFGISYVAVRQFNPPQLEIRLTMGLVIGAVIGAIGAVLADADLFAFEAALSFGGDVPQILGIAQIAPLMLIFAVIGMAGAMLTTTQPLVHNGLFYLVATIIVLGLLDAVGAINDLFTLLSLAIFGLTLWFAPQLAAAAETRFEQAPQRQRKTTNRLAGAIGLAIMLVAPIFLGRYITNVLDLVMLYIIMGIGLNVMVGFSGLLDLGYVASFAIGAYTCALLTTPSFITTGCVTEAALQYEYAEMCVGAIENWPGVGLMSFWGAWPIAVLVSALTGMALGVPVLRLRGDYLAIVTLGFGEITNRLIKSQQWKPVFGAAQGISPIPAPILDLSFINPEWVFELNNATSIYYLYVFSVLLAAFVVMRLAGARLGRAWRAMKADEDVAQAMGVHLVGTKLLAFGISSAFAGLGGALFAAQLRGIFPDSFTIFISINVLSLIIIGGLGSIPGVVLGALMLVGLPEVLRELQDYRLLVFGALLVIAMIAKPEGLLPPPVRRLSERVSSKLGREERIPEPPPHQVTTP